MEYPVFSPDYFNGEEREGFYVEENMKRAWAGQLVVLKEIDEVCKELGIRWFADYGTALGAIRHKGFIPWDDDIDIGMVRADYEIFIKKAERLLPDGYKVMTFHNTPEYDDFMCRVVNRDRVNLEDETIEKYYCPYALGLDIIPVDYLPLDTEERKTLGALIDATAVAANVWDDDQYTPEEKKKMLSNIEKTFKVKIHRGMSIPQQLRILADKFLQMYTENDTDYMGTALYHATTERVVTVRKEIFDELVEVPFETTTVYVPKDYDTFLKMRYGDAYMESRRYENHNYPFYKDQQKVVEEILASLGK